MPAVVKRRLLKLVVNFLFYFRTDEAEVERRGWLGPRVPGCGWGWGLGAGGQTAGSWGWAGSVSGAGVSAAARPHPPSFAPSPWAPYCWSTAGSPKKSRAASPSVSAGMGLRRPPKTKLTVPSSPTRAGLLAEGAQAVCTCPSHFLAVTPQPPALSPLMGSTAFSGRPAVIVPVLSAGSCAGESGESPWANLRGWGVVCGAGRVL